MAGQAPQEPPVAEQTIAITGSSTALAQFSGYTAMIRVHCDAICLISIGNSPMATNGTSNTLDGTDIIAAMRRHAGCEFDALRSNAQPFDDAPWRHG